MTATIQIPGIETVLAELRAIRELLAAQKQPDPSRRPVAGLFTVAEAAERLGVCESTIRAAIKAKRIRISRFGRLVKIATEEIARLEREGLQATKE